MKRVIWILSATLMLAACGEQKNLESLEAERSKLENEIKEKQAALEELDKLIAELKEPGDSTADSEEAMNRVVIDTLVPRNFIHTIMIHGVVSTDNNVTLSAEMGGKVVKIHVKEGQSVSKGQRLLDLDASVLQNSLNEIRTRLKLAEETFRKQEALWKQKVGSEIQYLQAKNNYEALKDQEAGMLTQIDKLQLRSPIDGTVDEVMLRLGEMASPGVPAVRVVNLSDIEVIADVSEKYVGAFTKGDKVSVYFPALKDTLEGKISAIGQVINPNNRTFSLRVDLAGNDKRLKPNLLAMINAVDYSSNNALVVPGNLIQTEGYTKFIMLAEAGENGSLKATKREITPGMSSEGMILVQNGLKAGDLIIVNGHLNLEAGEQIKLY